jgi:hypothetical protein
MAALMENRKGIADQLRTISYATPALVPATPWLGRATLDAPSVAASRKSGAVRLKLVAGKVTTLYAVWSRFGGQWKFAVVPASRAEWDVADDATLGAADLVVVSAVDRLGNESARVQAWKKV